MLRYFKGQNLGEVAAALRVNEAAAQRRVHRAVEKLRRYFTQHGVALSATALPALISAHSIQSAPSALAQSVTAVAAAKGAAAGVSTLTLIQGALKIMAWNQAKLALIAAAGVLLATGTTTILWHRQVVKDGWRHHFEAVYQLKHGEDLRYIATPYIAERAESYEKAFPVAFRLGGQTLPDFSVIKQDDHGALKWHKMSFGSKQTSLLAILNTTLGFWRYELEAPEELLNLNLPGDWTVREGANRETLLAALEPILFQATGRRVHFEKRLQEREVIVARGLAKRVAKVQMYAEKPDGGGVNRVGSLRDILVGVGEQLNTPMVNEAQTEPPKDDSFEFDLTCSADASFSTMGDRRAELTDLALKHLAAQTGLTFTREQRAVDTWVATEQP
jgi:hypothetical protein